jgi:predicted nicotinamide N-methyase
MITRSQGLHALLPLVDGKPAAMLHLARLLREEGQPGRAIELCRNALALSTEDPELRSLAAEVMSIGIPSWHFSIVRDKVRNAAYEAALQRAVSPGCRVLEIGTGTGLLAMMAARAGAAEVITCESHPAIAQAAREIVAKNGYADCVRIIAKHSTDLDPAIDLGEPADILVSEIVSNNLIGEDVLPVLEHASRYLLKPNAQIIPARGCIRVALAEDTKAELRRIGVIGDFDLSPFNALAGPFHQIAVGNARLTLRSNPGDLFEFGFQSGGPFPGRHASVVLSAQGGYANGIAQWIALEMDDEDRYENCPVPGATSCWAILFHPFAQGINCATGQKIVVHGRHDRHDVRIWADTDS